MSWTHETPNQQYANQLADSLAAEPVVGPAAIRVLRCFGGGLPKTCYTPRRGTNLVAPIRWTGTDVEDALAAFAMLEARQLLTRPCSPHHHGLWQGGSCSAWERLLPFARPQWTALFERYWTLLNDYMPSYGRTVWFSARMLTQLIALSGAQSIEDDGARAAFRQWVRSRQLQEQHTIYGTLAYRDAQTHRGSSDRTPVADARWMREHLSREHDTIYVTREGAFLRRPDAQVHALHLSAQAVRNALAYDASRADGHGEVLVARQASDGTAIVTLDLLLNMRVCPHVVDTLTSVAHRLSSDPHAMRIPAITNIAVRQAAADELQLVAERLQALVTRCHRLAGKRTGELGVAQASVTRLLMCARRIQPKHAYATHSARNTGIRWSTGLAVVQSLAGVPHGLTRADVLDVLPSSAWAYPKVPPRLHPLYTLLSPAGVRPSALVLAAHRYHSCPGIRADARIALEYTACVRD